MIITDVALATHYARRAVVELCNHASLGEVCGATRTVIQELFDASNVLLLLSALCRVC